MSDNRGVSGETLRRLASSRWLVPLLAAMAEERGSRFGVLARQLSISRSILSRGLDSLERWGWIIRNPGHGHPLRPEYLLTSEGRLLAAWCVSVMEGRRRLGLEQVAFGRWSLPILGELTNSPRRFSALEQGLAPITPRALSLALGHMVEVALVEREPSPPLYGLTDLGARFAVPLLSANQSGRLS